MGSRLIRIEELPEDADIPCEDDSSHQAQWRLTFLNDNPIALTTRDVCEQHALKYSGFFEMLMVMSY